ncbi:cyclodeaminase/cyclohydrolase family protein, partial [Klebsiella pneumoniae]|uniref:cyclodeaminase/cyclohydrolase family protein n=1 Tax=Klebsiella pneumoniae TaxID=573 RepID=UPI0011566DA1
YDAIMLHNELVDISSKIIISDIGVGIQFLIAAMKSAYLNILINVNLINDKNYVQDLKDELGRKMSEGLKLADEIYEKVIKVINE